MRKMKMDLVTIGFILLAAGTLFIILGSGSAKFAVGGFIGPVPFGFGSDPQLTKLAVLVSAIAVIFFVVLIIRGLTV